HLVAGHVGARRKLDAGTLVQHEAIQALDALVVRARGRIAAVHADASGKVTGGGTLVAGRGGRVIRIVVAAWAGGARGRSSSRERVNATGGAEEAVSAEGARRAELPRQ